MSSNRTVFTASQNFLRATRVMKIKRYVQLSSLRKAPNFVNHFIIELWSKYSGERVSTSSLQHILSCAQLFNSIIWNLSFPLSKHPCAVWLGQTELARSACYCIHNEGATKATFGLLMSQSTLLKLILSSVVKNEWLVFDIVGKTNKEKFALIRKKSEPCRRI